MRMLVFSKRTMKEITRDPLDIGFGLGFPLIVFLLLHMIQSNVPVPLWTLSDLTPGIAVFGLSFFTLFSAMLISRDRESAFLQRLYTTPLTATDFILGYALPFIPLALLQGMTVYMVAFCLGLEPSLNILWGMLLMIPAIVFYVGIGLLCGSVLGSKAVGGICGALFTNLSAWLSDTWFDVSMVGGAFEKIANALPFIHAVEFERCVIDGAWEGCLPHLLWVLGYAVVVFILAVMLFLRQMKRR